ncbi:hypothetical protein JQX13_20995 [Archangium violaceum]|uniref:hypothetical protein n=1 Tax=Archangium violaceum TaxID=83451 RepID=UPI00193C36DF|nr:hypothetical protein [Archangium violaceum]QRK12281.1 hypothetical protein JQX13_20995 [Archangium violaceum]
MKKAAEVVKEISEALREVDEQLRHHPYPDALERGVVSVEALRAFPGTQFHVATSDLRSMAMMVQRFGHTPAGGFLNGILQGEFAALEGLRVLARKLGMTQEDLERYEVTPEGFAYATNMAWMAANVSAAEFAVGILVNFPAWGLTCGRMSRALRERYGFTEQETVFLDAFANMPPLEGAALPIIQEGLDQGVPPRLLLRAARFFQAYEKMFWDAMMVAAQPR